MGNLALKELRNTLKEIDKNDITVEAKIPGICIKLFHFYCLTRDQHINQKVTFRKSRGKKLLFLLLFFKK